MEPTFNPEIVELPLGVPRFRRKLASFLEANSLRPEDVDQYLAILDADGEILAGGGLKGDVIKCIAVGEVARSQGLAAPLVSRLVAEADGRGFSSGKVFTKPENEQVFGSLGFLVLARAPRAVFMENGRGLEEYCSQLRALRSCGRAGIIVMNANPFTLGHLHLVREAASKVDKLFVIPVAEEGQRFPYEERLDMIRRGCGSLATVVPGSEWQISAATFPTYFLKDLSEAAETQMRLDISLFCSYIAPALGASVRFAGSEPLDPLTARYNAIMSEMLPQAGIEFVEVPRLCSGEGPVSASRVRAALDKGTYPCGLVPPETRPYLLADLMARALRLELDAPCKPGLVDPSGNGSHKDMDYALMKGSIDVIRRSFTKYFNPSDPVAAGRAAEADLLAFTGGVNTYRGAIFCHYILAYAALQTDNLSEGISELASLVKPSADSHGGRAVAQYGVKGALAMAKGGYAELFGDWLPYYRSVKDDEYALQRTLLHIMSTLDDTCIIHRAGMEMAGQVKREAAIMLADFSPAALEVMDAVFKSRGISPGGSADMLSLTVFADSIVPNNTIN
ncbi:MAG: triphosphoribosyl-dephospho-CoA synthase [Bacteroidales bacterium]|nr:triphosphoribosyl-dephospho-CoA synthase [Bacteroidales bacterium]